MKTRTPRTRARRLGAACALITLSAVAFGAMASTAVYADSPATARTGDGSSGLPPWLMIIIGLVIGIGIGMLIVVRAKRKYPMRGPGNRPGGQGKDGR